MQKSVLLQCNTEIEKEIESEIEIELELEPEKDTETEVYTVSDGTVCRAENARRVTEGWNSPACSRVPE